MTVQEFYESCECKSQLKVLSGYNGKVLCYSYDPQKHSEIGERELLCIWADIKVSSYGFGNCATPILCCHASGTKEYEAEEALRKKVQK